MKYYIGIDSSTSCTGVAVIDENNNLIFYDYAYTKNKIKNAQSLGEEFDIIAEEYNKLMSKVNQVIKYSPQDQSELYFAIEANSFGGYNTTMLLGITIGLMHFTARMFNGYKNIKYSAVGNWRSKILGTDPEENLTDHAKRNELKMSIANWAEQTYNIKLPKFEKIADGIAVKLDNGENIYDMRVNDISDAIGLAYCCKNNLLSDRKFLKIQTRRDDNLIRSLKNNFSRYRKLVEEWFKRWKKSQSKTDLKTLQTHINTLEEYYNKLQEKNKLNDRIKNWKEIHLKEIKEKINEKEQE